MQFEIQHYTIVDGWINTWHDRKGNPIRFATKEEADHELGEFLSELESSCVHGEIEDYSDADFRITPATYV